MRQRIEELIREFKDQMVVPTQEQIDRAEAVAIVALGDKIHQQVTGGVVTIAALAILLNREWITNG